MSKTILSLVSGFAVMAAVGGGAGVAGAQPWGASPGASTTLADQFFHVEYSTDTRGQGQSEISGYVYNDYGQPAANVELAITEMDADGQPVGTEVRPVSGLVPAKGRAYFDVRVPRSASYRVTIRGFDFIEFPSPGGAI